jgi:RNA polymerase sigma factor (TIGR02999 family)
MESDKSPGAVTQLLDKWSDGDDSALAELMPVVYEELAGLAAAYLRRERPDHTMQTADLVNEAYLRLVDQRRIQWQNRGQFFGVAAQMMRRILVNHARKHLYAKRGGGARKLSLDEGLDFSVEPSPELVALDDALTRLESFDPRQARVVELRFFAGLTSEEICEVLGVSVPTVTRDWRTARAWLYRALTEEVA